MERRGGGFIRNEGKRNVCAWWSRAADYLDPPIQWRDPDGGSAEKFEHSEHRIAQAGLEGMGVNEVRTRYGNESAELAR